MNLNRLKLICDITYSLFAEHKPLGNFQIFLKIKNIIWKSRTTLYILFFSLSILSITACQTNNSLSLKEAKEVSTEFQDLSLRIPARTIQDAEMIKALRDWRRGENGPRLHHFEKPGPLCSTQSSQDTYEFGRPNHRHLDALVTLLPMFEQNRATPQTDHEHALAVEWDFKNLEGLAETIGKQYEKLGDIVPALKWLNTSSKLGEKKNWPVTVVSRQGQLLYLSSLAGDLEAASKQHLNKIKTIKSSFDYESDTSGWAKFWVMRGEAAYHEALGHLDEAATKYSTAISLYRTLDQQWPNQPRLAAHLAMVRMKQGRLVEAEAILISGLSGDGGIVKHMPLRNSYSTLLYEQGRYIDAINMGKLSLLLINESCVPDVSSHRAMARNNLARAFMATGRWQDARLQFDKIKQDLKTNIALYEILYAGSADHALSLIQSGESASALPVLKIRAERLERLLGPKHYDTAQTKAFLAMANLKLGNLERSLNLFFENVPLIIQRSRQSITHSEGTQSITFRKRVILESYLELLAKIRGTNIEKAFGINAISEAFKIADIARSSTVERLLAQSSARSTAHTPELSNLARKEQDLQRQISAQWASLSTGALNGVLGTSSEQNARTAIDKLRSARATLMEEIEREFPGYANTINPPRVSINDAKHLLHDEERLLTVYMGQQKTFVWSVTKKNAPMMYVINQVAANHGPNNQQYS